MRSIAITPEPHLRHFIRWVALWCPQTSRASLIPVIKRAMLPPDWRKSLVDGALGCGYRRRSVWGFAHYQQVRN